MRSCRQLENKVFFGACGISFAYRFSDIKIHYQFFTNSKKKTDFYFLKLTISDWSKQNLKKLRQDIKNLKSIKTDFKAHTEAKILLMYDWLLTPIYPLIKHLKTSFSYI